MISLRSELIPPSVASRGWTSGIDVHLGRDICWATVCYDGTPQLKGTIRESFGRDYFAPYLKSLLQSYPSAPSFPVSSQRTPFLERDMTGKHLMKCHCER